MHDLQLLTSSEVARLLRVSRETVRSLAAAGELPGRKVGRAWRFPQRAMERYLRQPASPAAETDKDRHVPPSR